MKYFLCVPHGGLNDMFCQIVQCLEYCMRQKRKCYIATSHTPYRQCLGTFFDVYDSEQVEFVEKSKLTHLDKLSVFPPNLEGIVSSYESECLNDIWFEPKAKRALNFDFDIKEVEEDVIVHEARGGGRPVKICVYFQIKEFVKAELTKRLSQLPETFPAVHIRHTDYNNPLVRDFLFSICEELDNKPFFLCSDNAQMVQACLQLYPYGKVFSKLQPLKEKDVNLHISTSDWMTEEEIHQRNLDAILDLLTLAHAEKILFSFPNSGYTSLATILRFNKPYLSLLLTTKSETLQKQKAISYHTIQPFSLESNRHLYFDIFRTQQNTIMLLCPRYCMKDSYFSDIEILYDYRHLKQLPFTAKPLEWDSHDTVFCIEYEFPYEDVECANVLVSFRSHIKQVFLRKQPKIKQKEMLIQSLLFKHEKRAFPLFHDYYSKLGVGTFYLYYNGKINSLVQAFFQNYPNVKVLEWDFQAIHQEYEADVEQHAQPGQIAHVIHKYGKLYAHYLLLNEMSEFIDVQGIQLMDLLRKRRYDLFQFEHVWADTIQSTFVNEFPQSFFISSRSNYPNRSRCIVKLDTIQTMTIQKPISFTVPEAVCPYPFQYYCFWRWSGKYSSTETRIQHTRTPYNSIDLPHFLKRITNTKVVFIPGPDRFDSALLTKGTMDMFKTYKIEYEIGELDEKYEKKIICMAGGRYLSSSTSHREFLEKQIKSTNIIILLSQTLKYIDDLLPILGQNIFIICRELRSYMYCQQYCTYKENILLSKDMSLYIQVPKSESRKGEGMLNSFKCLSTSWSLVPPVNSVDIMNLLEVEKSASDDGQIQKNVDFLFGIVADYQVITTNRIYIAIVAALLDKQVMLYIRKNSTAKYIYDYSLREMFPKIQCIEL